MVDDWKTMIYLSGRVVADDRIGVMLSFNANHTTQNMLGSNQLFALDNGCFSNPYKYSDKGFLNWLDKINRKNCLFAVAPDVVGDAKETLKRSLPMLPKLRSAGYQAAFIAQDGATEDLPWDEFDCLFIGGTTDWKLSQQAGDLIAHAKKKNKWVHVGRVNSYTRIKAISVLGADSCDGTFLAFGPDKNLPILIQWLSKIKEQPHLRMY